LAVEERPSKAVAEVAEEDPSRMAVEVEEVVQKCLPSWYWKLFVLVQWCSLAETFSSTVERLTKRPEQWPVPSLGLLPHCCCLGCLLVRGKGSPSM
jgi:hypothetical protein